MASSSRRSGVHIQVTTGLPFTSSQTGTSSTAACSDMRPPRLAGWVRSGESGAVGIQGGVLHDAHSLQHDVLRQAGGNAGKQVGGNRLTGWQSLPVGEHWNVQIQV